MSRDLSHFAVRRTFRLFSSAEKLSLSFPSNETIRVFGKISGVRQKYSIDPSVSMVGIIRIVFNDAIGLCNVGYILFERKDSLSLVSTLSSD